MGVITLQHQHNSAKYQQEVVVRVDISSERLDAEKIKNLRFQDLDYDLLHEDGTTVRLSFYSIKNTKLYTGAPQSEVLVARELVLNTPGTDAQVALTIFKEVEGEIPGVVAARDRAKRLLVDARLELLEHFSHVSNGVQKSYGDFEDSNEYIQNLQHIADTLQDDVDYIQGVKLALLYSDIESEVRADDPSYSPDPTAPIENHGFFPSLFEEVDAALPHLNLDGSVSKTEVKEQKVEDLDLTTPPQKPARTKKNVVIGLIPEDIVPTVARRID